MSAKAGIITFLLSAIPVVAQQKSPPAQSTSSCTFADGTQISIRYNVASNDKKELPDGKVWAPGGSQMVLFTQSVVTAGSSELPVGAYSMYLLPEKKKWKLVVNKNVSGSKYDPQQDVVRVPMESGELGQPTKLVKVVLAHVAPKKCSMRLYRGSSGVWMEFTEK